jgi:hypothetical protein
MESTPSKQQAAQLARQQSKQPQKAELQSLKQQAAQWAQQQSMEPRAQQRRQQTLQAVNQQSATQQQFRGKSLIDIIYDRIAYNNNETTKLRIDSYLERIWQQTFGKQTSQQTQNKPIALKMKDLVTNEFVTQLSKGLRYYVLVDECVKAQWGFYIGFMPEKACNYYNRLQQNYPEYTNEITTAIHKGLLNLKTFKERDSYVVDRNIIDMITESAGINSHLVRGFTSSVDYLILDFIFSGQGENIIRKNEIDVDQGLTRSFNAFISYCENNSLSIGGMPVENIYQLTDLHETSEQIWTKSTIQGFSILKRYVKCDRPTSAPTLNDPILQLLHDYENGNEYFSATEIDMEPVKKCMIYLYNFIPHQLTRAEEEYKVGIYSTEFVNAMRTIEQERERWVRQAAQQRERQERQRARQEQQATALINARFEGRQRTKNAIIQETQPQYRARQQLDQQEKSGKFKQQAVNFYGRFKASVVPVELRHAYDHYLELSKRGCESLYVQENGSSLILTITAEDLEKPEACFNLISKQAFNQDLLASYSKIFVQVQIKGFGPRPIDAGGVSRTVFSNAGKYIKEFMIENQKTHTYKFKHEIPLSIVQNIAIVMTYSLFLGMPLGIPFSSGIIYLLIRGITQEAEWMDDDEYLGTLFYLASINVSNTDPFKNVRNGIEKYYIPEADEINPLVNWQEGHSTRETRLFSLKRYLEKELFYGRAIYRSNPAQSVQVQQTAQEVEEQQVQGQQGQGQSRALKPKSVELTPQQRKEKNRKISLVEEEEGKIDMSKKLSLLYRVFIHGVTACNPPVKKCLSIKDIQTRLGVQLSREIMLSIPVLVSYRSPYDYSQQPQQISVNDPYVKYYKDFINRTEEKDWVAFLEFITGVSFPPKSIKFQIKKLVHTYEDTIFHTHTCFNQMDVPDMFPQYTKENSAEFGETLFHTIHSESAKYLLES